VRKTVRCSTAVVQESAAEACRRYFADGFYCAESVLLAIAEVNGRETMGLSRLMTGLCGGISRSGGPCGALLGGIAAIGLLTGRDLPGDDKRLCYSLSHRLVQDFEGRFGVRNCYGVLPCDIATAQGAEVFVREGLGETICPKVAEETAALVQALVGRKSRIDHPLL